MSLPILAKENIVLHASIDNKEHAIRLTGDILVKRRYADVIYAEKVL